MRHLKTFSTCLVALALHSTAWAEIYETTDAQGNPEFTDSPPGPDAEAVDLQQTNIIDAPPQEPQQISPPQSVVNEQVPQEQENHTVIIHDGNNNENEVYDEYSRRERAFDQLNPDAPREVLDGEAPRQVGDSDSQMPREIGDSDTQMSREADDADAQLPGGVENEDPQIRRELGGSAAGGEAADRR